MSDWKRNVGLWWWQMGKRIDWSDSVVSRDVAALAVPTGFAYDGRLFTRAQWLSYLKTQPVPAWVKTITTHHTANPTEATWRQYGGWSYWGPNMATYYHNRLGWHAGPMAYVSYEGIGYFTPLPNHNIHAGATANAESLGVEIVGLFTTTLPTGETLSNAAWCFAALLWWAKLPVTALRAHRQYLATQCPGNKLWAEWSWWQGQVATQLAIIKAQEEPPDPPPPALESRVAALETKVTAHGVTLADHEKRLKDLEQARLDLVAADEALSADLVASGEAMDTFEQRLTTMEAALAQAGQQYSDLAERVAALEEINTPGQ